MAPTHSPTFGNYVYIIFLSFVFQVQALRQHHESCLPLGEFKIEFTRCPINHYKTMNSLSVV